MTNDNHSNGSNGSSETAVVQYDEQLNSVAGKLIEIAEQVQDETLQSKLYALAEQTSPQIKGIDTPSARAKIPILQLRQAMTAEENCPQGTKPGQMYTTSGMFIGDELKFYPIYTHNIRKKWGEDRRIDCQSLDGKFGSRYGECRQCPYGQFEKGMRPECSPGTSYFILTEDFESILQVDFTKTNSAAGRKIKSLALPPALWSRPYVMTVDKQQQQGGSKATYYTYSVRTSAEKTPPEKAKICDILFEYFYANHKKAVLLASEYAKRSQNGSGGPHEIVDPQLAPNALDAAAEPNTDALDFSESV